jgi:hypothetical protein
MITMTMLRYSAATLSRRLAVTTVRPSISRSYRYLSTKNKDDEEGNIFIDIPELTEVRMPEGLGPGTVARWYKQEGDLVKYDEVYVDIETVEFAFGMSHDEEETVVMHSIVAEVGEEVEEGEILCIVLRSTDEEGNEKSKVKDKDPKSDSNE